MVKLKSKSLEEQNEELQEELGKAQEALENICFYRLELTLFERNAQGKMPLNQKERIKLFYYQDYFKSIQSLIEETKDEIEKAKLMLGETTTHMIRRGFTLTLNEALREMKKCPSSSEIFPGDKWFESNKKLVHLILYKVNPK